ncbi:MAG: response regulator [Nitrospira sp.]
MAELTLSYTESTTSVSPSVRTQLFHAGCVDVNAGTTHLQPVPSETDKPLTGTNTRSQLRLAASILVVEDDPDISMGLQDLLEFQGFLVDCVATCTQAFSSLDQHTYDAVLLDLGLPDGDGRSVLARLRISNPALPVIVLTASNNDLGPLRPYARLTKPWEREELCAILLRAIGTASSLAVK